MDYRREIDGLRALAVLPVLLFHAKFQAFSGGFIGVDVFFVISGYLITSIIVTERLAGSFTLAGFYERRARRILPALYAMLVVCVPLALIVMLPPDLKKFSQSLAATTLFSSNFYFYLTSGYFETNAELTPLLHTWSLAVEEQYYLLFPLLMSLFWKMGLQRIFWLLMALALVSLGLAQWGSFSSPAYNFYQLPTRSWEILAGALCGIYLHNKPNATPHHIRDQLVSLLGLGAIVASVFIFDTHTPWPSLYALLPVLGTVVIILWGGPSTMTGQILGHPLAVGIGLISYSAYLWHQPLFAFVRVTSNATLTTSTGVALLILTFVLAYTSWRFIEKPFRNRDAVRRKSLLFFVGLATLVFMGFGMVGHQTHGFLDWHKDTVKDRLQRIDQLTQERADLVRVGICHYNAAFNPKGIADFLSQWDCALDKNQPTLKQIPLIVTGDSHSADKVMALKLNGYVPLQMAGAGCSIIPKRMTQECKLIFDRLYRDTAHSPYYKTIALANLFEPEDLSLSNMKDAIDYWQKFNKNIILFTAMPVFKGFSEKYAASEPIEADFSISDISAREELVHYVQSRGVHIVNTRDIFCADKSSCNWQTGGQLLLIDPTHLSKLGAKYFGTRLLKIDPVFRSLLREP